MKSGFPVSTQIGPGLVEVTELMIIILGTFYLTVEYGCMLGGCSPYLFGGKLRQPALLCCVMYSQVGEEIRE